MIHDKTTIKRRKRVASMDAEKALHNVAVLSYLNAFVGLVTPPEYIKSSRVEADLVARARHLAHSR